MIKFRDNLYIGGIKDLSEDLSALGITAILTVAYEVDVRSVPPPTRYMKVSLSDSNENPEYLKHLAVDSLEEMLHNGERVFVHCAAGASRSVYTAVMAISRIEKKDWHDVYEELHKIHPFALLGPLFHGENKYYYLEGQIPKNSHDHGPDDTRPDNSEGQPVV